MVNLALLDHLRHGAEVISTDRQEVGRLHAVVLDPRDDEVTAVVVNTGPHFPAPGFGAPDLVCVPIEEMADAQEGKVTLKCTRKKFARMPSYVERSFVSAVQLGLSMIDRNDTLLEVGAILGASMSASLAGIPVPVETFRKAKFERHILNDAPVWRQDPHEKIGEVELVLVDEEDDSIEGLVIRKGFFFEEDVVLPVDFVTEVLDGVVHVQIGDEELRRLQAY